MNFKLWIRANPSSPERFIAPEMTVINYYWNKRNFTDKTDVEKVIALNYIKFVEKLIDGISFL